MECELPVFYEEKLVVARKPHQCCETGRTIKKGESYWRCTGKWDGGIETHTQSQSAYHFARHINITLIGECVIPFGGVNDHIAELRLYREHEDLCDVWDQIKRGEIEFTAENEKAGYPLPRRKATPHA